jgi:Ser/Thr protein kinase RdoA (MazF antagonist)
VTAAPAAWADPELARLEAVARAALARFGIPERSPLALLHHRENTVFRVDDVALGRPFALRVHRAGYRSAAEIRSELWWMDALREVGIHTPHARPGRDGDPVQRIAVPDLAEARDVDVLSWIEGRPLDTAGTQNAYRLVGRTSALIQRHGRGWTPPPGFTRPTWDAAALIGEHAHWGNYADLAALQPSELALLDRAAAVVRLRLEAFGRDGDRFGLTHGDLMPDNILVEDDVPHVIDFDDCGHGWYLYDLATLLATRVGAPDYAQIRDAWIEGYRGVAPLPVAHEGELETLVLARLLLALGWMHTRRETPLAQGFTGVAVQMTCAQAETVLAHATR